ncbi:hypothetical protein QBC44DRAFT_385376 [Cladorrhinum sp. PSN332]|nr:hypothetical protein QBC44DRAFT_385376 [Cladorrhinum sp. PSN332]
MYTLNFLTTLLPLLLPALALATAPPTYKPTTISPTCLNFNDYKSLWDLASKGTPLFHFANYQSKYPTCWPAWPFRPDGSKRLPAAQECWPLNTKCNQPGKEGWGENMPVFWTAKQCPDKKNGHKQKEVRVSYSVFWQKDGFSDAGPGHDYDWETVIVIWRLNGQGGEYVKDEILLSGRGKFRGKCWGDVPETVEKNDWTACGLKNRDHAKVYVGWCEHSMFFDMGGSAAKGSCDAHGDLRGDDYWFAATTKDNLIGANPGTDHYKQFCGNDWGKAAMKPSVVYDNLCEYEANMM